MTPDMQRLCEAAEVALEDIANPNDLPKRAQVAEAVVRSVLAALSVPSASMEGVAMGYTLEADGKSFGVGAAVCDGFTAMIDHVLAEPSRA